MSRDRFLGKRAIVTGGASGIGAALVRELTNEGAIVAVIDRHVVEENSAAAHAVQADLSDPSASRAALRAAVSALGGLDVLVNNAATCSDTDFASLLDNEWEMDIAVDVSAPYRLIQEALPALRQSRGVVVNIASVNALGYYGNESYSAAKAALLSLTRSLGVRLGPEGIRVNAVAPGTIVTPIWDDRIARDPEALTRAEKWYPLGRLGTVSDVAAAVLFLASTDASWITGTTLVVDGGLTAGNSVMTSEIVPES